MADKELLSKLEDMVECPVCLEQFKDPRLLPCHHSFCTECLQGLLGTGRKIKCPCCNKEAPVPNGVQELPVDFRANTLLETVRQPASEEAGVLGAEAARLESCETDKDAQPCPVCNQNPTSSTNLSCGHRLCGNCVEFLLPVLGDTLHCPTCSSQTRILLAPNTNPDTPSLRSQPENAHEELRLTFHPNCGKNAVIHANRITAHRKSPQETVYGAIVITSRHLRPNELFEVRLDKKVDKWSGSILIAVTTHSPTESASCGSIYNLGPGTWYMVRSKVWQRGLNSTTIKQYEQDLIDLKVGERVGVQRRADGSLHFYINGVDLGVAASDIPAAVYGVVDIYCKAEQVTIIHTSGPHTGEAM